jgi:hypothetical protein
MLKKKYKKIYIIKLYDIKKSNLKKKIKFTIFLGFENKNNKNYLNLVHTNSNILFKNNNEIIKLNKDLNFVFSIEKTNPYILNITKIKN